jgi:hypothetical protein
VRLTIRSWLLGLSQRAPDDRDRAVGDLTLADGSSDTRLTSTAESLGHGSGWFAYSPLGLGLQVPKTTLERTVERPLE